jgi:AraC-like DNA-binding protein
MAAEEARQQLAGHLREWIGANAPAAARFEQGTLRVGTLVGIPQVLREFGADPAEIMASVGLDLTVFEYPDNTIPFTAMGRLLGRSVAATGCPHFGLLAGQRTGVYSLGVVGYLMQHSPDVGAALQSLIRHLHLHDRGAVPTLSVHDDVVLLGYAIYEPDVEGADQIYDGAIAIAFNVMRALCDPDWLPTEVLFAHRKPRDARPYRRFFEAPLRFDAEQTALVFPASWLEHRLAGADPDLRRILEEQVDALDAQGRGDIVAQLRRVLRTLLVNGKGSSGQVAQLFSMHRRTLNRRLEARDTTLHALIHETRFEIARQLLRDTDAPVSQIAATLDYADASAFTRAFKRWSQTTPAEWRGRNGRA